MEDAAASGRVGGPIRTHSGPWNVAAPVSSGAVVEMRRSATERIEPMAGSAITFVLHSGTCGVLFLMAHPQP